MNFTRFRYRRIAPIAASVALLIWQIGANAAPLGAPVVGAKVEQKRTVAKPKIKVRIASEQESYASDETVIFNITAKNTGDTPQVLNFHSAQQYDIVVTSKKTQKEVWRWSHNQKFKIHKGDGGDVTLAPGETLSFTETWYQVDENKNHVPAGVYKARAILTSKSSVESSPVSFRTTTK